VDFRGVVPSDAPFRPSADIRTLDLLTCRELLGVRLGSHFLHSASTNKDQCVSPQVCKIRTLLGLHFWLTLFLRRLFGRCPRLPSQLPRCKLTLQASHVHIMCNGTQSTGQVTCESFQQEFCCFPDALSASVLFQKSWIGRVALPQLTCLN
jgi:hypothetical protein